MNTAKVKDTFYYTTHPLLSRFVFDKKTRHDTVVYNSFKQKPTTQVSQHGMFSTILLGLRVVRQMLPHGARMLECPKHWIRLDPQWDKSDFLKVSFSNILTRRDKVYLKLIF